MAIIDNEKINISGTYVRNLDGAKIVDGKEVEGGYFVCESLPTWGTTGQLCYCTGTASKPVNKFYSYNGSAWVESSINMLYYSNETPIVNGIGSIKPNQTFTNVPLSTMLDWILYPYVDLQVNNVERNISSTADSTSGTTYTYYVHNIPTLYSVTLHLKKNSATNLSFSLYDGDTVIAGPLTEENITSDNTLVFNLGTKLANGQYSGITMNTTSNTYTIKYSFTGENDATVNSATTGTHKHVTVGKFNIEFQAPSTPSIAYTKSSDSADAHESNGNSNTYYSGQTIEVTSIQTQISDLGSTVADGCGFTKLEVYKSTELIGTTSEYSILAKKEAEKDSILDLSAEQQILFDSVDDLSTFLAPTINYKVKAYYKNRTGDSITLNDAYIDSDVLTIKIEYQAPTITSLEGIPAGNYSRLVPQTINNPTCYIQKNSGQITKIALHDGSTIVSTQDVSGMSGLGSAMTYSDTAILKTFEYSAQNICSDKTFWAIVYNEDTNVASTSESEITFYSPSCWGFVDGDTTLSDINLSTLKTLASQMSEPYKNIGVDPDTFNGNIIATGTTAQTKFLFMSPGNKYTKALDPVSNDVMTSFEGGGSKNIVITFDDGKTTETYQVFLAAREASEQAINYTFS